MNITFQLREDLLGYRQKQDGDFVTSEPVIVRTAVYTIYTSDGTQLEFTDVASLTKCVDAMTTLERDNFDFNTAIMNQQYTREALAAQS